MGAACLCHPSGLVTMLLVVVDVKSPRADMVAALSIRGVAKGPRQADPAIHGSTWSVGGRQGPAPRGSRRHGRGCDGRPLEPAPRHPPGPERPASNEAPAIRPGLRCGPAGVPPAVGPGG